MKKWTKNEVEIICKRLIGKTIKIEFVNKKSINNYQAMADPYFNTIKIAERTFNESVIWHECGHFLFNESWVINKKEKESIVQIRCIQLALDMNKINIAKQLIIDVFNNWGPAGYPYRQAKQKILNYFNIKE